MTSSPTTNALQLLSLSAATDAIGASIVRAQGLGIAVNISVYDASLHLLSFSRMPGAKLTSIDIAHNKAFTAAGHRLPTDGYKERVEPGGGLFGVHHTNGGRFCTIQGGEPVLGLDGGCLGAIGVSGGTPQQDKVSAGDFAE